MSHQVFIQLIRLGIGHNAIAIPESINWITVEVMAKQHGLLAVVLDGVERLQENQKPSKELLLRWIGEVAQVYELPYELYRKAVTDLAGFYNANDYRMMLLKGLSCSLDWPKPQHRPYGDIDIWLFGKQKESDEILSRKLGVKIDNSHHHHTVFKWQGFAVENHYSFINVHHHKSNVEFESILKELGNDDSRFILVNGKKIYLPSPNLNALFLLKHMMIHFAAEGITLRQVLDWGFFVKEHKDEVDWFFVEQTLERFGMKRMYDIFNAICVDELGFDLELFPKIQYSPIVKDRVLKDMIEPEFSRKMPKGFIRRSIYKYRRWEANEWKHVLCYNESMKSAFWSGVWNHVLKPASI